MNKKLLAVAVSAALVAPVAAMAGDVAVYGQAQVEVASYSDETPTGATKKGNDGVDTVDASRGRVGVKASEDLGMGLKAFAQFEFKADTTDNITDSNSDGKGKGALTSRVSQVGLKGGFGTVALGNLKSPYKYTGGVKYDPFVATSLQARGNGGMTSGAFGHNSFVNDSVMYSSPKAPVTASLLYAPSEDDGAWILAVKYKQGGIEAFISALDEGDRPKDPTASGDKSDSSAVKIGGQYKMGMHKFSAQVEQTEENNAAGTTKTEADVFFIGYQATVGKNVFVGQYGSTDVTVKTAGVSTSNDGAYMSLGVIHKMSKMTRVFGGWRDTEDFESVVSIGLRKDFK